MHAAEERRNGTLDSALRARTPATVATPDRVLPTAPARLTASSVMALQRTAGNAAVTQLLHQDRTAGVPAAAAARPLAVQRVGDETEQRPSTVISGHGRFGDQQMIPVNPGTRSRALKPTFTVPDGVEVVVYAPPGAWLENQAANRIEEGNPPTRDQLALTYPGRPPREMPEGYPKTFTSGSEVINYKITPLQAQHLAEGAETVDEGITLQNKVNQLLDEREAAAEGQPPLRVHYACCGVGSSSRSEVDSRFEYRGYTVELRTLPVPGKSQRTSASEEEPSGKRRRKSGKT
jgi:hypothetical protein